MRILLILIGVLIAPVITLATSPELQVTTKQTATLFSIPPGSQRVPMLELELTAGCSADAPVRSITLYRRGLGQNKDIERLYLMSNGKRITRGKSINNRSGKIQFTLNSFTIPACDTSTLIVMADMAEDANVSSEHRIILRRIDDIDAGDTIVRGQIGNSFPRRRVVGTRRGTIRVRYVGLNRKVRFGRNQTVSRFRLEADSSKHHLIRSITLTNDGSATNGDLQNIVLQNSKRRTISNVVPQLDNDRVTLHLDPPLFLKRNKRQLFRIQADPRGRAKRTIKLVVKEPSDIDAVVVDSTRRMR